MRHVSTFAGIGGFDLGFGRYNTTAWVEWDAKCQRLLADKFPEALAFGDIREVSGADLGTVDVITGGFPCQDISIAGPRRGLAGDRSGLFWEFVRLLEETGSPWFVLENVAGLLSSGQRRDLGAVLGALVDRGYGVAYRVLDAQYFGVPQRRRRVFVVGHLGGDPSGPAEVLALTEGGTGAAGPVGEARQGSPAHLEDGAGVSGGLKPILLRMRSGKPGGGKGALLREDQSLTLATGNDQTLFQPTFVRSHTRNNMDDGDRWVERDTALSVAAQANNGIHASTLAVDPPYRVRKLMPVECERLQGFPDGWTAMFPDTTRYHMLGNAVAVPVTRWIADRMRAVDARLNPDLEPAEPASFGGWR